MTTKPKKHRNNAAVDPRLTHTYKAFCALTLLPKGNFSVTRKGWCKLSCLPWFNFDKREKRIFKKINSKRKFLERFRVEGRVYVRVLWECFPGMSPQKLQKLYRLTYGETA